MIDTAPAPRAELLRALAALAEEPQPEHGRLTALLGLPDAPAPGMYTDLFVLNLHPYASVHLGAEGMLGGEARDRVAGFWRALGLTPPREPDHLAALLGLLAELAHREEAEAHPEVAAFLSRARGALVREHLLPWLPPFLDRVAEGGAFYAAWAVLLGEALTDEAARLPTPGAGTPPPLHLRDVPPLPDPRGGVPGRDFLQALLAPVRSGMILTRRDLSRAGRDLALGVRQGERRYILEALLAQDPAGVLRWLADEARGWARRHRERAHPHSDIQAFWEARATATAHLLDELAASTRGGTEP